MTWKTLISDLQRAGLTQVQIAQICGCGQSAISKLAIGPDRTPSFPVGQALLALHKKTMRRVAKHQAEA